MLNGGYIRKICLGTAQFGMDYGISNRAGMVSAGEAHDILDYAVKTGIAMLDTAPVYGISEEVIGKFISDHKASFRVVSKMPSASNRGGIEEMMRRSLDRLKTASLYGYLVHSVEDFLKRPELWDEMTRLKSKGLVGKIGFSVYSPADIEKIFDRKVVFDIIQFPYSIFDRRFEPYLSVFRKKGVEAHARSVFLQGLAFLDPYSLPKNLEKAKDHILRLKRLSYETGVSVSSLCLNFVLANALIDSAVIGVDGLDQLRNNIEETGRLLKIKGMDELLDGISMDDEDILLPYRWNRL